MKEPQAHMTGGLSRRGFLGTLGATAAGISLSANETYAMSPYQQERDRQKGRPVVRGAFLYPPTAALDEVGYYSWPGSSFDAEGRQRAYTERLKEIERVLDIQMLMEAKALDEAEEVNRFIDEIKTSKPDGLLLIPFKKGHWEHVTRIIDETGVPAVVLATLGVLLVDHINQLHRKPGVYLISSLDNLDAVAYGMKMIKTGWWMRNSRIINIAGSEVKESNVSHLGTQVRAIPHARFCERFQNTEATDAVKALAKAYQANAKEIVQPTEADILEAAKTYFVLKEMLEAEEGDALMMDCLPGLGRPHKHVPPCMGFMSLRDEGIAVGCQSDLSATLSLMLVQHLFGRPGFQQNAAMETEKNHYFGAHCTSPSKMNGVNAPSEPYMLMSHAEAGWGCVPRVLFTKGQDVTMAQYLPKEVPQMLVYTGQVVGCPPIPPAGGCRTNIEMTINEVDDVCKVKGMHQAIFYGNYGAELRAFCQLHGIEVLT